ncbi:gephyrin-like molybdotransferase Glp [Longimicrobium sp.]|uniref:molybdopterin molybdotransferase MoeA n=1 Tax=Longimicrobium sp. TaxID=2029185 RepID=UPI002BD01F50|nr:gephyrin-like molybdotransferase Glp [Longimicrobium sp.]HSU15150.1 gephyrin-like molybdotransferase Glp [Longimicrobium sp.]
MPADRADWLSPADALRRIVDGVRPIGIEARPLLDALGHILAEEVASPVELPPWDNSAMDGFAVRAADVRGATRDRPAVLRVVDDIAAGGFPARALADGEAARIMTGAPVPAGADGVVRVEHTDGGVGIGSADARVAIFSDADAGKNVRPRGEDVRAGQTVLAAGTTLRAPHLAVAAAVGRARLRVHRRPVVAVVTSGDELVDLDRFDEVRAGRKIVSSNSYALAAQLAESGIEARVPGIARDTHDSLREMVEAARGCDALVTSAGISVGEHDHVRAVMREMDTRVEFWRVRIKPGSALAFGHVGALGGIPWFGLPGNPVSTMVTFELFVRPALLRMCGRTRIYQRVVRAVARDPISARGELLQIPRLKIEMEDGTAYVRLTGAQGSGIGTSMATADALGIIPAGSELRPGDAVRAVVLGGEPLAEVAYFGE